MKPTENARSRLRWGAEKGQKDGTGSGSGEGLLQGLRPAVIAMIASAGLSLIILSIYGQKTLPSDLTQIQIIPILIFIVSLAVLRIRKPDPIKVMASAGAAGIVLFSLF